MSYKSYWYTFKAHKRGYYALWLFGILFILSLLAEFIANDKPLLIQYNNSYYFPIVFTYTEQQFGGDFDSEPDYKEPFLQELISKNGGQIVWTIIPFSYDTIIYDLNSPAPTPPDSRNWLGTDEQARDVLARVLYGFRLSVSFGFILTIISSIIGIIIGAVQGYYGGLVDLVGQRLIEIFSGLPVLFLLIIISNFINPNFWWLLFIMLLFSWMSLVSLVRAEFLRTRNLEYILAAKALGQNDLSIMFKHILPNALVTTLTFLPFMLGGSVVVLTSLDFLGFGLPPTQASLGELLAQGKNNLHAPWLGVCAFVVLSTMLCLVTFIGEAIRDSLNVSK